MIFSSYEFLFLFLPVVLAGYYLVFRARSRMIFLTVVSYCFYGWWDYRFCSLMLVSTLVDYIAGKRIAASDTQTTRRGWLTLSIVSNLSLLGFFKYFDLAARTVNHVAHAMGVPESAGIPLLNIVLPVGISFYTFQSMSYSIDIYLKAAPPARRFWDFACYVALFPQLIAGPIVRYRQLADQLRERTHSISKCASGIRFFILGLAKKVILADGVASLVADVFGSTDPGLFASWTGLLAYAFQIYFDFSGYSDMAVGLGLMFGFKLPQNFNSPYKAISVTDFWRRWHISLSSWLRDYLYIPLGGNRLGPLRTYVNLFITMLLGGLWHGASWTFVVWGAFHGLLLAIERAIGKRSLFWWAPDGVQRASTFALVLFGWVWFRCQDAGAAIGLLGGLLGLNGAYAGWARLAAGSPLPLIILGCGALLAFAVPNTWEIEWRNRWWSGLWLAVLLVGCIMIILVNTSSPFLYFQF